VVEPSAAVCVEHPGRAAATACVRCGTFICDWCVKLAPSWGPGLCAKCQKLVHASSGEPVAVSRLTRRVGAILIVRPLIGVYLVAGVMRFGMEAFDAQDSAALAQASIAIFGEVLITFFCAVCLLAFWLRRSWARRLIQFSYGLDFLNSAAAIFFIGGAGSALLVLLRVTLATTVLIWATASQDAKRLFAR
jgi:hypothetical protein